MNTIIRRRSGNSRGQGLIEFTLSAFLLVMLLIGVVEIGHMILTYATIANAARVGTRYAIVYGKDNPTTVTTVTSVVQSYLSAAGITTSGTGAATVNVCYGAAPGTSSCSSSSTNAAPSSAAIGSEVTVQVSYAYVPFIPYFPLSVNLGSTSQGVIAY